MDSNRLTCLGIDNTGKLVLTYGQEDCDYYTDGDPSSGYVYRAAESTFFCRVRDLLPTELEAMYVDRESANAWSATGLINQWDAAQSEFPEELWRLDIQRKYFRTYQGISIDNSIVPSTGAVAERFLKTMLNGRKKYQRRMFERNQELYMATKYFGNTATQDQIMMRFNNPADTETDFTLYLTPYSDMYIGVKFGNFTPINFRAKAGKQYTVPYTLDTADITLIYGASFIQEIGDLSKCYVGDNDFSKASRLQKLSVGSDKEEYSNNFMTTIGLGSNKLLEYLDVCNVTGLNSVIDLSQCNNLMELHAEGSGATGAIFANGGKLQKAYLPSITSLTAKNLSKLETFDVESYNNLQTLIVENTPFIDSYKMVTSANKLTTVRLIGIDWGVDEGISDTSLLDRLMKLSGIDNSGYGTSVSVLSGTFHSPTVKEKLLAQYNETWSDLVITYDTLINQFVATFKNWDNTVLNIQYVDKGETAVDPVANRLISTPTRPSSVSTNYTYSGWDLPFTSMFGNQDFTAQYDESVREYSVTYKNKGVTLPGYPVTAPYGTYVHYEGETPTYTGLESGFTYNLFSRWDDSGFVDGDKVINAVYDTMSYSAGYYDDKDLSNMSTVELYALTTSLTKGASPKVNLTDVVDVGDSLSFTMGADFDYGEDVETHVLIDSPIEFTGKNYHDTEIKLFDEDKDFVLAVDYEFTTSNSSNATLIQCYQADGMDGFEVVYNTTPTVVWGNDQSVACASGSNREMLVLRHKKGETGLHVYMSNLSELESDYIELARDDIETITDATLVFGCKKVLNGDYYLYKNNAIGKIHWAKLWMSDLGDSACQNLVKYIHEKIEVQLSGTLDKNLSDVASTLNTMSFFGSHAIYGKRYMYQNDKNTGGFAESEIAKWLEARFYEGMPTQLKQLVKKVKVSCSVGNSATNVTTANCHIYIPAITELSNSESTFKNAPYTNEESDLIPYVINAEASIRKDADGNAVEYWTRSTSGTRYFYKIDKNGNPSAFATANLPLNIVIKFSI